MVCLRNTHIEAVDIADAIRTTESLEPARRSGVQGACAGHLLWGLIQSSVIGRQEKPSSNQWVDLRSGARSFVG
jgi:hypothetical protein